MAKIPVNIDGLKTEVEPLDDAIPYHVICRKLKTSEEPDKNGNFYLTGGVFEILEPAEWEGRQIYVNYVAIPESVGSNASLGERRRAEEQGVALARMIKCLKVSYDNEGFDPDDVVGCEGDVTISNEEYQGRVNPKVRDWLI